MCISIGKFNLTKKGFTLSEIMITVLLMGILAMFLSPVITKLIPNKNKFMFKKAYMVTENAIDELINDDGLYPDNSTDPGFMNTATTSINGVSYGGVTKFCQAFASKVNLSGTADCSAEYNFTTNDGIVWSLPKAAFDTTGAQIISVDVSGGTQNTSSSNPNCAYDISICTNPDIFHLNVYNDGKINITGTKEMEYLDLDPIGS